MKKLVDQAIIFLRTRWDTVLYALSFILFWVNSNYVAYPDEFVNILGGQFINQGRAPYIGFFDHHLPLAWYLAAIFLKISFGSFILFRKYWMIFVFLCLVGVGRWIKRHHSDLYPFYLIFVLFYPIMGVYFWFHLYIADSLAILFFSLTFWLLLAQTLTRKVSYEVTLLASFLTFCLIFSSLTYLYLAFILYVWEAVLVGWNIRKLVKFFAVAVIPYIVFGLSIVFTGAIKDFYFSNFTYNTQLYIDIPNYTRGHFFNPLKFGMTIMFNFYNNYLPLLSKIKHMDLYLPIGTLAASGSLALLVLLLWRFPIFGVLYFFVLSFSAPRSDISNYHETDYQGALFLVFGLISSLIALYLIRKIRSSEFIVHDMARLAQAVIAIFMFFSFVFLFENTYSKFFQRYIQKIPNAPNHSFTGQFVDMLVGDDYYWMGPYMPDQEFFVKRAKLPGKYPTLLPQFRENDHLKQTFLEQFEKNPPKIIVFQQTASIFNTPAVEFGKFFLDWMSDKYTQVEDIKGITVVRSPSEFNLRTDLYLRNDQKEALLQKLHQEGYVQ